jgi:hypothetical protein
MAKKQQKSQSKEIIWNIVNSLLAGGLVFLGACTSGGINKEGIFAGLIAAGIVAVTKFYNYWEKEEGEYSTKLFSFIR